MPAECVSSLSSLHSTETILLANVTEYLLRARGPRGMCESQTQSGSDGFFTAQGQVTQVTRPNWAILPWVTTDLGLQNFSAQQATVAKQPLPT